MSQLIRGYQTHLQPGHLTADAQNITDSMDVDADGQFKFLVKADSGGRMEDNVHVADQGLAVG